MKIYIYILVSALVSFIIRALPLTIFRKKIKNKFFSSFLYYVPYVTLAVMTFPAIIEAAGTPLAGIAALAIGIVLSWLGAGLFPVALSCCLSAIHIEWISSII